MPKSVADANARKKKEEEEKQVVGQQQKTQPEANKPTGSSSIPKQESNNSSRERSIESKTPERQAKVNYNRQQQSSSPKRDTENVKTQNRNERRNTTVNRNVTHREAYTDTDSNNRDLRSKAQKAADRKIDKYVPSYSKSMGAANSQYRSSRGYGPAPGYSIKQPDLKGYKIEQGQSAQNQLEARNIESKKRGVNFQQGLQTGNNNINFNPEIDYLPGARDLPDADTKPVYRNGVLWDSEKEKKAQQVSEAERNRAILDDYLYSARRQAQKEQAFNDVTNQRKDVAFRNGTAWEGQRDTAPDILQNVLGSMGSGLVKSVGDIAGLAENLRGSRAQLGSNITDMQAAYEQAMNSTGSDFDNAYYAYKNYVADKYNRGEATPEELQNMVALESKALNDPLRAVRQAGEDAKASRKGYKEANEAAVMAGDLANTFIANSVVRSIPGVSEVINPISLEGKTGLARLGAHLANGAVETAFTDLPITELPKVLDSASRGESADKIAGEWAKDFLWDTVANGVFNAGGDVISNLGKRNSKTVADTAKQAVNEAPQQAARQAFESYSNPYSNVADDVIAPSTFDDVIGRDVTPEIDGLGTFDISNAPKEADTLIRNNGFRNIIRDNEYAKLVDIGGKQGPLDDALSDVIRSVESGDKSAYDAAMNQYRQLANASGIDADRILNRLDRYVKGEVSEDLETDLINSIANNIDGIDAELKKLDAIGVPPTQNGSDWLTAAHEALDDYEKAVFEGGDVTTATDNLNRALGNLDRQAKKLEGYDGAFSAWKGGGTARGDLYSNSSRVPGYGKTEWTDDMINELNETDNYHAKPANQNVVPGSKNMPQNGVVEDAGNQIYNSGRDVNTDSLRGYNYGENGGNQQGTIQPGSGRNIEGYRQPDIQKSGGNYAFTGENGQADSSILRQSSVNNTDGVIRKKMNEANIVDVGMRYSTDVNKYSEALKAAKDSNEHGVFVSWKSPEELQEIVDNGGKLLLDDYGRAGVIIAPNGDIEGVFHNGKLAEQLGLKKKGAMPDLMITAISNGGDRLDCYGEDLARMYMRYGFEPVAVSKYVPDKPWSVDMDAWKADELKKIAGTKETPTNTDVYVLKLRDGWTIDDAINAASKGTLNEYADKADLSMTKINQSVPEDIKALPLEEQYDAMMNYRDSLLDMDLQYFAKQPEKDAFFNAGKESIPNGSSLPNADTDIPNLDEAGKNMGKRRTVTNSAVNADIITKEQLENDPIIKDIASYQKHKNETSLAEAIDNVTLNGEAWKNDILSGKKAINSDVAVDTTMLLMRDLDDKIAQTTDAATKEALTNQKNELLRKLSSEETNFGQMIQALAKWNNTADGAMLTATKVQQDDVIKPWKTKNATKVKGNSKIAKALADMGNDTKAVKEAPVLTHEQIKEGVRAELEREVGSVEKYFNDNDLEFLTQLAEDKSIPVWQITDEIEHKLKNGTWYTLDESIEMPKTTNKKLQNALNNLIEGQVRQEKAAPSLSQVTKEVRNTLEKEAASMGTKFTDDDIDYLSNLVYNNATKQELTDALNTKMATGSFGISAETQEQVNALFKQAQMYNPNSKEFVEAQSEALRLLANEVAPDATPLEKFETWRYMAMLGNPKTMLRNYVGNKMFSLVTGISNNIAAVGEAAADKTSKALGGEGIQRTKSVLNPLDKADKSLIEGAGLDMEANRYRQAMGSKYEKVNKDTLKQHRSVWKSSAMQKLENLIDAGISDYKAVKKKYSTSLAGYLKANGFDSSIYDADVKYNRLKNLSEDRALTKAEKDTMASLKEQVDALEKARDYALSQAEYATFHEDNAFAKWLTSASNNAPTPLRIAIEGVVPFKKTPANILKSGIQYSPLNAIDSIQKTGKLIYENTGSRKGNLADTYIKKTLKGEEKEVAKTLASDVIDSWAKTLTGGGLLAMGYYLYDKGILNDSDKDTQYQDQLEGLQNYSLTVNGKTYTIDWTAPAVMPLLLGAEISKIRNSEGKETSEWYENLDEYLNAANRLADPIVETSMLSGIKDSLETAANAAKYNENLNIPALLAYNSATGYLTQGIPTLSGQIARTLDNTRRSTYTDKEGVAGVLEKQGRKLLNKIPGLSTLNEPYVDTYGREQKNGPSDNALVNLGYQMFSPGYLADINTTNADILSRDVYEKTGNENVLPQWQSSLKINKEKVSPEKYTEFAKQYGNVNYEIRDALSNDEWFNGLNDEEKAEILKDVNNISKNAGQAAVDPEFTSSSKPYIAYSEGGIEGLVSYYKDQQIKDIANESGLNSNSKYSKEIQEDLKNSDTEAAQQKIDSAKELDALGILNSTTAKTYDNAKTVIPTLTAEEFADTYTAMDANGKSGISQKEFIDWANNSGIQSEAEMQQYYDAYYTGTSAKVPVLENGEWKMKANGSNAKQTEEVQTPNFATTSEGSVDIHNRPVIPTSELKAAGWDDAGDGYATVFSSTYSNADETDVRNFTPIVVDDNGQYVQTVSPEFLKSYAEEVIDGKHGDYYGLQIGGSYPSVKDAVKAAEQLHEDQEKEYGLSPEEEETDFPTAEELPDATPEDTLNWALSNGYDLKNTKTYQRAVDAGVSDADFNAAWFAADADGNGYMKKTEAQNYVSGLPEEERDKWFHILYKGR